MNVIIIEDEQHNLRMLQGMIEAIRPEWKIVNTFESVKDSIEWLSTNSHPDLIFMDIQLTDGISFAIFDSVEVKSLVIFTTAYDDFAIKAFKVNSIDYLLKPIKEDELEKAICKFENYFKTKDSVVVESVYSNILKAIKTTNKQYRTRFLISGTDSFFKVSTSDIAYFYSDSKITFAVTFSGKEHIVDYTLEKLEEELNPDIFFRANRHTILNIDSIERFENYFGGKLMVFLTPPFKNRITVSRLKATIFKMWIGK